MAVSVACPEGYRPPQEILDFAAGYDCFELTDDPMVAAKDADVVITDVWTSMGQEEERVEMCIRDRYDEEIATFDEDEVYDQKDSAGFINLFGLPIKVQAQMKAKNGIE